MNLQEMLTGDGFFRPLSNIAEAYVDLPAHPQRLMYADVKTEAGKLVRVLLHFEPGGASIVQVRLAVVP